MDAQRALRNGHLDQGIETFTVNPPAAPPVPSDVFCCPHCHGMLSEGQGAALACASCEAEFPGRPGGFDLRPRRAVDRFARVQVSARAPDLSRHLATEFEIGPGITVDSAEIDRVGLSYGNRLSPALLSRLEVGPGDLVLDIGCGGGALARILEPRAIGYIGVDYDGGAPYLADALALPFVDASFDGVVTIAVMEHVRSPHLMMQEAARVLKPGGTIVGTSAFLEVFHMDSHFHTTALGVIAALEDAGFVDIVVVPTLDWDMADTMASMGYLVGMRGPLRKLFRWSLTRAHRVGWRIRHQDVTDVVRRSTFAGGFRFSARRGAVIDPRDPPAR